MKYLVTRKEEFTHEVEAEDEDAALKVVSTMDCSEMNYVDSQHEIEQIEGQYDWKFLFQCPNNEHRIYKDRNNEDNFALADDSIKEHYAPGSSVRDMDPAHTENGLLFLDMSRPLTWEQTPLKTEGGVQTWTTGSVAKALFLSRRLDWDILLPDGTVINIGMETMKIGKEN